MSLDEYTEDLVVALHFVQGVAAVNANNNQLPQGVKRVTVRFDNGQRATRFLYADAAASYATFADGTDLAIFKQIAATP